MNIDDVKSLAKASLEDLQNSHTWISVLVFLLLLVLTSLLTPILLVILAASKFAPLSRQSHSHSQEARPASGESSFSPVSHNNYNSGQHGMRSSVEERWNHLSRRRAFKPHLSTILETETEHRYRPLKPKFRLLALPPKILARYKNNHGVFEFIGWMTEFGECRQYHLRVWRRVQRLVRWVRRTHGCVTMRDIHRIGVGHLQAESHTWQNTRSREREFAQSMMLLTSKWDW